jgi:hypothetical protein
VKTATIVSIEISIGREATVEAEVLGDKVGVREAVLVELSAECS